MNFIIAIRIFRCDLTFGNDQAEKTSVFNILIVEKEKSGQERQNRQST